METQGDLHLHVFNAQNNWYQLVSYLLVLCDLKDL